MTARRDHDTLIRAYLEDGPTELPGRSFDAVRDQIDHARQRVVLGPSRSPHMNNFARLGIAAAAVLVVAVVGVNLRPGFGPPGASPSATTSVTEPPTVTAPPFEPLPSLTTSPTGPAIPALPMSGDIAPGTYYRVESGPKPDVRFTFTVPAGWTVDEGSFLYKDRGLPGEVMLVTWYVSHIFADACGWEESPLIDGVPVDDGRIVDVGTDPHELVLALTQQAGREETAGVWPWQGTIAGVPAEGVELAVPADLDTGTCTSGILRYWPNAAPDFWPNAGPDYRYGLCCNTPGNIDFIYAMNINGFMFVVVARHYADSSAQALAELDAILQSMEIQ